MSGGFIGQKNKGSGNFRGDCFVSEQCIISRGHLDIKDLATFARGLNVNVIRPWRGTTVTIEGDVTLGGVATKGDILVFDGTTLVPVGAGADGEVLTVDSASPAGVAWLPGGGGGGGSGVSKYSITSQPVVIDTTSWVQVGTFSWDTSVHATPAYLEYGITRVDIDGSIRIMDGATQLAVATVTAAGFTTSRVAFGSSPAGDTLLSIQVQKEAGAGTDPQLESSAISFV